MSTLYRVVLDTNVLASGLVYPTGPPGKIVALWRSEAIHVVLSTYILDELERVLPRIKRDLYQGSDLHEVISSLSQLAEIVAPGEEAAPELRDTKDQPVLGTFLAARANFLVTGDKDLLSLAHLHPVLTPAEFLTRLRR